MYFLICTLLFYVRILYLFNYFNRCEEMEHDHRAETDKLADELEEDIKKLQQKLISETKRSGWEALRRSIFHAMQNDF